MILHETVELQKRVLPFRKGFFIINNFVNRQKALKSFFITVIAKNTSSLFFAPVSILLFITLYKVTASTVPRKSRLNEKPSL